MLKNLLFTALLLLLITSTSWSQRPGGYGKSPGITGKISGQLVDSNTQEPLPYASVVVTKEEKQINGTITQDDGSFKITNIPIGKYTVLISFVGYETISRSVELTPKNPDVNLERIELTGGSQQLDEVVIAGERDLIENKIDKIVYNAQDDVANAGGDASDVLRRAPLLNVDLEGNVSLRGSQNVQILINGKPSSMFAGNPGDALKSIPSDNIKSVEVITTPSAKYDGEGTAGIINIITKKSTPEGFAGSIDASVGNLSNRGVLNLNAGKGRLGFNSSASAYYSPNREGSFSLYREDIINGQSRILQEDGPNISNRLGFFGSASAFYDFNAFHSLSTAFRLRGFSSDRENNVDGSFIDPINDISQRYERINDTENLFSGYEWSLDYIYKFPGNEGQELAVSYKIDGNVQDQRFLVTQSDQEGNDASLFQNEKNENDGDNRENTIQIDYTHPFNDNFKLESGFKTILRDVKSDFRYDTLYRQTNEYVVDPTRTDIFDYNQDVLAGYVSSNIKLGDKYGLVAGVRYERTEIDGDFQVQESPFSNSYENWLPSVILSRKIGKFNTLKGSYSRRIQRPSLRVINPYVQLNNNRNISFGNPALEPELTDQYELSYGTFVKSFSLNTTLFYMRTTGVIESFLDVNNEGLSTTTFRNIGQNDSYGVNFYSSVKFLKIVTLRGGLNVYTYNSEGVVDGQKLSRDAVVWDGNLNGSVKFENDWIIDLFGFYRAPRQTLQGTNPSFSIFVMGVKKEFSEKFSLGVRIVEPFFANKSFGSELKGENFIQTSETEIPFRSFGINLSYKFGKLDFKQRTRRSKINNQDQEDGGDGQNQF
ncbi:TonB-dependent receptor [Fulvivirga sp. RKSG066]|uniref:TonB-dependent receptor domain-containing protein n=1 Tax=Fulvivirga aurantia TaxID=2529383 RepID=UPI0012BD79DC|nr:TonB-dependent receptor [Fulvivirga aurantia]MTI22309.1 TonB-dependent receptor [Fulvivirga aurantia]